MAHDTKNNLDYLEPYGFTSTAHPGAEGVALFLAGDRSHGVVIQMADRRYRLTGLQHHIAGFSITTNKNLRDIKTKLHREPNRLTSAGGNILAVADTSTCLFRISLRHK